MTYAVQTIQQLAEDARAERIAFERATFAALLRAFDAAIEADDSYTADRERRRAFNDCHIEAAAVLMGMEATIRRSLATSIVATANIFRDLTTSNGEDRREAGAILRLLAASMRRSWGLT